ncbi:MAG: hydantoinase/oxoprolinase family protein [Burkholderiaceae bacterium]
MASPLTSDMNLCASVDIGGTFTDVSLMDRTSGQVWTAKVPTTTSDPSVGFMTGIGQALAQAGATHADLQQVVHGTTVATNLILEGKGAAAGLITTTGFRHVLEIGRHGIPRTENIYAWQKPERPVPIERIYEVGGTMDARGVEILPLDEAAVRNAARRLKSQGVSAVAICLLHSYANDAHERAAREILQKEWPECSVTMSSAVLPTFREYERSMATILNAYVMPAVSSYLERLEKRLRDKAVSAPLMLMKSNGGIAGSKAIRREPVQTALSGPAAGVVGMQLFARLGGFPNVIGVDIGGTSADISLIRNGEPGMTMQGRIGSWPLTLPMVDINTIGAGGGSIARVSENGALSVGPDSAGATPGPVCYGRGGTAPTVTDAHAVLGHLPATLLNGAMQLDVAAAREALDERIARPLGLTVEAAARGILDIADNKMVGATRVISVERGHDPRDFVLMPFGGAGPLHGGSLARLLGIRTQLLPPSPGVLSAVGLLASHLRSDFQRTCRHRGADIDIEALSTMFDELRSEASAWFDIEGVQSSGRTFRLLASMRYRGQGFELRVPWDGACVDADSAAATIGRFHEQHQQLYTFAQPDIPVEIVTLHVEATASVPVRRVEELAPCGRLEDALIGEQTVHFSCGSAATPLYERSRLGHGAAVAGPAIFVQLDTTILMLPGQRASVDRYGNLRIDEVL